MIALQEKLYNLNYAIRRFTGVLDSDTRKAILAVQRALRDPQDGRLTQKQWREIQRARVSKTWGAIAYNANATHSFAFNRASRQEAEEAAHSACRRRAGRRAKCVLMAAKNAECIVMAKYRERWGTKTYFGVNVNRSSNMGTARNNVLQRCEANERSRGSCEIVRAFCANGSHEQGDQVRP